MKKQQPQMAKNLLRKSVIKMACAHTQLPAEFVAALDRILNGKCPTNEEVSDILYEHLHEFLDHEGDDDIAEAAAERDLAAELAGRALAKYKKNNDVGVCIETLEAIAAFCPDITGHHTHCADCEYPVGDHGICVMCIASGSAPSYDSKDNSEESSGTPESNPHIRIEG